MEEEENGEAQRGGGQEDQADVAGYHEVTHHQRHFVLVHPASPVVGRGWWVPTASHAPCSSVHNQRETKVGGEEGGGGRGGMERGAQLFRSVLSSLGSGHLAFKILTKRPELNKHPPPSHWLGSLESHQS